jgi:4-hydroxy-3-polyprenylbenzoate decarboxylase
MIVAPCAIKTLPAVANCYTVDLVARAADVCLKKSRPLVLMVRETPVHLGHLRAMTAATEAGAIIAPPDPGFYSRPTSVDEIVDQSARRVLARVGLTQMAPKAWMGLSQDSCPSQDDERDPSPRIDRSLARPPTGGLAPR